MPTLLEPITYEQGWRVYTAEAIKSVVDIPVAAVGVIRQPAFAEEVLARGRADFVAIGRDLLTDAEMGQQGQGRLGRRRSASASPACTAWTGSSRPTTSPARSTPGPAGSWSSRTSRRTALDRVVAVIGGGPRGMEAARVLSLRGFRPVLYEKRAELGGELVPGCRPPKKDEIGWYKDYLKHQMRKLNVDVRLNTEATPAARREGEPLCGDRGHRGRAARADLHPRHPRRAGRHLRAGAGGSFSIPSGQKVVVVGGGLTGCEIADMLALGERPSRCRNAAPGGPHSQPSIEPQSRRAWRSPA
jgi:hypothetical protein